MLDIETITATNGAFFNVIKVAENSSYDTYVVLDEYMHRNHVVASIYVETYEHEYTITCFSNERKYSTTKKSLEGAIEWLSVMHDGAQWNVVS